MDGTAVYNVLSTMLPHPATHLHHANSVTTSCTFLEQGGLLSRGFVEGHGLVQTPQPSDAIDKKYGIWDRIFLDHVDIHYRGGRVKGPNKYGPVLMRFDLGILLQLPEGSEILVTRCNPMPDWHDNQPDTERWFTDEQELRNGIAFGEFNKMLVIKTPTGKLDFPQRRVEILLDNPERQLPGGESAYCYAEGRLNAAAAVGGIEVSVSVHDCRGDCSCLEKYAAYSTQRLHFWFT